jgi:photosystem II stability/assembly factor-like uncharacterized protein
MKKWNLFLIIVAFIGLFNGCVKSDFAVKTDTAANIIKSPSNLKGFAFSSNRIDLTWSDSANNEEGFKILRKSGTEAFSIIGSVGQNVLSYSDTALKSEETYSYKVYAFLTNVISQNSNQVDVTTLPSLPIAPSTLKAVVYDASQIDLSWMDLSSNETGFKVERKAGSGSFEVIASLSKNEIKYSDKTVVLGTTYSYRISAFNTLGNSNYTNQVDVTPILTPNPTVTSNDLYKINFVTDHTGFIAGNKVLLKTINGGTTWSIIKESSSMNYTAVKFIDSLNGYLGGNDTYYSYLYNTKDGGITWTEIDKNWYQNNTIKINDILFVNNTLMYILNSPSGGRLYGRLFFLNNNKVTNLLYASYDPGFFCLDYINGNLLIGGSVYWDGLTYLGGALYVNNLITPNLNRTKIDLVENIYGISSVNNKSIAVGGSGSISFSSNSGVSWSSRTVSGYGTTRFNSTTLIDVNNGYIVGDGGLLLVTTDGGLNWTKMQNPNSENVNHITKKPNGSVYMVGNNGVIIKVR